MQLADNASEAANLGERGSVSKMVGAFKIQGENNELQTVI